MFLDVATGLCIRLLCSIIALYFLVWCGYLLIVLVVAVSFIEGFSWLHGLVV